MSTNPAAMPPPTDKQATLLAELNQLRRRARQDVRRTSVPLLVFGLLVAGLALVGAATGSGLGILNFGYLYVLLGVPAALIVLGLWYYRNTERIGAGQRFGPYTVILLVLSLVLWPVFAIVCALYPFGACGLVLLAAAAWQRNASLAAGAVVLAAGGELIETTAPSAGWTALLAAILLSASFIAYRREKSA